MPAFHFSSGPRLPEGIPGSWPSKSTLSAHTLTETSTRHGTSNAEPGLCSSRLGDLMAVRAMSRGSLPKQGHGSSSSLQIALTQRKETLLIVNLDNVIIPLVPWNFVFLHLLVDTCTANSLLDRTSTIIGLGSNPVGVFRMENSLPQSLSPPHVKHEAHMLT